MKEGPLKKEQVTRILKDGINLMSKALLFVLIYVRIAKEANTVKVGEPIVIVGDLHG